MLSTQHCSTETQFIRFYGGHLIEDNDFPHNTVLRKLVIIAFILLDERIFPHNTVLRKRGRSADWRGRGPYGLSTQHCSTETFRGALYYAGLGTFPFHTTLFYGNRISYNGKHEKLLFFPHNTVLRKRGKRKRKGSEWVIFPHNTVLRKPWTFSVRSFKRLTTFVYLRVFPRSP